MRSLSTRLERIERQLNEKLATQRCPLCLDGNVWRSRVNGKRQLHNDDPIFDDDWHCRAWRIHRSFVERRLSPGGAADILACAWWVDRVCTFSRA